MKWKKSMLLIGVLLAVPFALAELHTTTLVYFNVQSVTGYILTLPGEGDVAATQIGAATTAIEFNSTTGNEKNISAKVVGGTPQSDGVPIFVFDNTGTVDLNISVILDSNTPACMNLTGGTTFAGAIQGVGAKIVSTTETTVVEEFGPWDGTQDWYMMTSFEQCEGYDTTTRTMNSTGIES